MKKSYVVFGKLLSTMFENVTFPMYTLPANVAGFETISPDMPCRKFAEYVTVGVYGKVTVCPP
jgi:hypothetical protein